MNHTHFMKLALEEAEAGYERGEGPVGALLVYKGEVIARAGNRNREMDNPLLHAEMIVIREGSEHFSNERLSGCELYVTKEPCAMCAGAIVHARISRVIIGARDHKGGACGTVLSVCGNRALNHVPEIVFGVCEDEAVKLLKAFFRERR
jgi:tRNA(adenine34) deaminase